MGAYLQSRIIEQQPFLAFVPDEAFKRAVLDIVGREDEVEARRWPSRCVAHKTGERKGLPEMGACRVGDGDDDFGLGVDFSLEAEAVLASDVLKWVVFARLNIETQSILAVGIAKADVVFALGSAVGNDVEVEPWRIPCVLVLEVVRITLGLGFQNGERRKEYYY